MVDEEGTRKKIHDILIGRFKIHDILIGRFKIHDVLIGRFKIHDVLIGRFRGGIHTIRTNIRTPSNIITAKNRPLLFCANFDLVMQEL